MSRRYGPIGTSIWSSEKFMGLSGDSERLAYLYLIACPHGNSVGVFRLPIAYFASDRNKTVDEAELLLRDMERVNLIERGDEGQIRVIGWFRQDTGARNPSSVSSFCKVFEDYRLIPRGPLRDRAAAEMIHASLTTAESWNPETKPFGQMIKDITNFAAKEYKRNPQAFINSLKPLPVPEPNGVLHMVLHTVLNTVLDTVWTYEHEILIQETGDERLETGDWRLETGDVAGSSKIGQKPSPPPQSPPIGGGQSGSVKAGGKVPQDLQDDIANLTSRAKGSGS